MVGLGSVREQPKVKYKVRLRIGSKPCILVSDAARLWLGRTSRGLFVALSAGTLCI